MCDLPKTPLLPSQSARVSWVDCGVTSLSAASAGPSGVLRPSFLLSQVSRSFNTLQIKEHVSDPGADSIKRVSFPLPCLHQLVGRCVTEKRNVSSYPLYSKTSLAGPQSLSSCGPSDLFNFFSNYHLLIFPGSNHTASLKPSSHEPWVACFRDSASAESPIPAWKSHSISDLLF